MRSPGRLRALYALLTDRFHLTLADIYDLTPRQIQEVYLHPRDDQGAIKPPPPPTPAGPRTDADRLGLLHRLAAMTASGQARPKSPATREKLAALIATLEARSGDPD